MISAIVSAANGPRKSRKTTSPRFCVVESDVSPTKFEQALSESMDSRISKDHRDSILELYLDGEWNRLRFNSSRRRFQPEVQVFAKGRCGQDVDQAEVCRLTLIFQCFPFLFIFTMIMKL